MFNLSRPPYFEFKTQLFPLSSLILKVNVDNLTSEQLSFTWILVYVYLTVYLKVSSSFALLNIGSSLTPSQSASIKREIEKKKRNARQFSSCQLSVIAVCECFSTCS